MKILIAGGGITGLTAAYRLQKLAEAAGVTPEIIVVERDERLGGQVQTDRVDGLVIEEAPDSFLMRKPWLAELCQELGLPLVGTNQQVRKTYVLHKGALEPLPSGIQLFIPTKIRPFLRSRLLSPLGKLRALAEPLVPVKRSAKGDEAIGSFVERRFGPELLERIAAPMTAGVYGGDPYELSLEATFPQFLKMERERGSLLLGARRAAPARGTTGSLFQTVPTGLRSVIDALLEATAGVQYRTATSLTGLAPLPSGKGYAVELSTGERLEVDAAILTLPAYASADLIEPFLPAVAAELNGIQYASVVVAALAYNRSDLAQPLDATGFLVPASEALPISASTWVSTKWPHTTPDDKVLLRGFLGRDGGKDWTAESDEAILAAVKESFRQTMGLVAEPILTRVFRWPRSRPRYKVGHLDRVARIEGVMQEAPGLYLAGAAYRGLGLPDCVREGADAAQQVAQHLGWNA